MKQKVNTSINMLLFVSTQIDLHKKKKKKKNNWSPFKGGTTPLTLN